MRPSRDCRAIAVLVLVVAAAAGAPAAAVSGTCGDGVVDPYEFCDEGSANGTGTCCNLDCRPLVDTDRDGVCDDEDPCASPASLVLEDARLTVGGFATPANDDTFRLAGTIAPTGAVDPGAQGFVVLLRNRFSGIFVRAVVPGGDGWSRTRRGGWVYHDGRGTFGGVTRISVTPIAATPERLTVAVEGRRGDYGRVEDIRPVQATVALAAPHAGAGQCAEAGLSVARCEFSTARRTLKCAPPPRPHPCASLAPDAQIRCEALNAAAAEEAFFVTHGTHFSGPCAQLPGFTPSAGVLCLAIGDGFSYVVFTSRPDSIVSCTYASLPAPAQPRLVCG